MKKERKVGRILISMLLIFNMIMGTGIVKADAEEVSFYVAESAIITFEHSDRPYIHRFNMIIDRANNIIYQLAEDEKEIEKQLTIQEELKDSNLKKVLKYGYPNVSIKELGSSDVEDAYIATQEAIYMICDNKSPEGYITPTTPGQKEIDLAKAIVAKALLDYTPIENSEIQMNEKSKEWKEEGEYLVKEYTIKVNGDIQNSHIVEDSNIGIKITDLSNQNKVSFQKEDAIKVWVPKNNLNQNFNITLTGKMQGNTEYVGIGSNGKQYAYVRKGEYEAKVVQNIRIGEVSNVLLVNKDYETKEPIVGNSFELLDESGNLLRENLITDANGTVLLRNVEKGNYQIKQKEAILGYNKIGAITQLAITGIENEVTVTLYNQKKKATIEENNNKQEVNVTQEDNEIHENNTTDVTNIHTTNNFKEIVNQINETNWYNNNDFINTINRKNIKNKTKNNLYNNIIKEEQIENETTTEIINLQMSRADYINYMDCIRMGSTQIPKLPVTGK